ncbi:MAG: hypothetical protein M3Y60_10820 [Bacteroidota bacterium]|nr:hypothetical protein [Bacteroidota bacterium]
MDEVIEESDNKGYDKDREEEKDDGRVRINAPDDRTDGKSQEDCDAAQRWGYFFMDPPLTGVSENLFFLEKRMINGRNAREMTKEVAPASRELSIGFKPLR